MSYLGNRRTLLELVQDFCVQQGLRSPSVVMESADDQVLQAKALLNWVVRYLARNYPWEVSTYEVNFTTVAQESQGYIEDLAPNAFLWINGGTIYNRTLRLPVYGPVVNRQWQGLKALPAVGPYYKYRLRGGQVLFNPVPAAGNQCYFEYASKWLILAEDGTTRKAQFDNDNDVSLIEDEVLVAGLEWRWRYVQGLDYAEEASLFQEIAAKAAGMDATKPLLTLHADATDFRPGIFVPSGNWPIIQ